MENKSTLNADPLIKWVISRSRGFQLSTTWSTRRVNWFEWGSDGAVPLPRGQISSGVCGRGHVAPLSGAQIRRPSVHPSVISWHGSAGYFRLGGRY